MRSHNLRSTFVQRLRRYGTLCGGAFVLCGLTLTAGCGNDSTKKPSDNAGHQASDGRKGEDPGQAHVEEGPHKGQLIEFGKEEYHGELLHDDAAHKITIYLLDGEAKKGVSIGDKELTLNIALDGKPSQYKLPAVPQSDDPAGQASRFELVDQALCEALDDPKCKGRLNVTVAGKSFSGEISHHEHEDHK